MWLLGWWIFPLLSALMWLGMLLGMFLTWEIIDHHAQLPAMQRSNGRIAYISDIGATDLKPLFIAGSAITTIFLDIGFLADRWLRHTGRLAPNTSKAQKVLSSISIFFAIAGSAGLILLSIFDTLHYQRVHDGCLLLFMGGYILSAIFICAEYQRLGIHYRNHRIIRISFWVKLTFILVEIALAIVFIALMFTHHNDTAAIFEWIIALIFTFYVLSFLLDLLPSVRTKHHIPQGLKEMEMGSARNSHTTVEAPVTTDSAGPNNEFHNPAYRGVNSTPYQSRYHEMSR